MEQGMDRDIDGIPDTALSQTTVMKEAGTAKLNPEVLQRLEERLQLYSKASPWRWVYQERYELLPQDLLERFPPQKPVNTTGSIHSQLVMDKCWSRLPLDVFLVVIDNWIQISSKVDRHYDGSKLSELEWSPPGLYDTEYDEDLTVESSPSYRSTIRLTNLSSKNGMFSMACRYSPWNRLIAIGGLPSRMAFRELLSKRSRVSFANYDIFTRTINSWTASDPAALSYITSLSLSIRNWYYSAIAPSDDNVMDICKILREIHCFQNLQNLQLCFESLYTFQMVWHSDCQCPEKLEQLARACLGVRLPYVNFEFTHKKGDLSLWACLRAKMMGICHWDIPFNDHQLSEWRKGNKAKRPIITDKEHCFMSRSSKEEWDGWIEREYQDLLLCRDKRKEAYQEWLSVVAEDGDW